MTTDMWTCGHEAGAMCAECYRELAAKAHELAVENLRMRAEIDRLGRVNLRLRDELDRLGRVKMF